MPALDFDTAYPIRVSSGHDDSHPTVVETSRNMVVAIFERSGEMYRAYSLDKGLTWSAVEALSEQTPIYTPSAAVNDRDGFALAWGNPDVTGDIWFAEINEIVGITQHLMGVRIQRATGTMSKGAEIELANPGNRYDPEKEHTAWTGVMYPGAKVMIDLGYGGHNERRFKGFIDEVTSEDGAGTITLSCRGDLKQLLDQNLKIKRTYTKRKRTKVIADLCVEAGLDADEIYIEDSARTFSATYERERTFSEVVQEQCEELGYEIIEPDEGGIICRRPTLSATPVWFYEEEKNMYTRERSWNDDEVYSSVVAYRDTVYAKDGATVKVQPLFYEEAVATPFFTPPKKCDFIKMGKQADITDAQNRAHARAIYWARQGREIQIITPLNIGLEAGDTIFIRRKSWNQSGLYYVEALDDDCKKNMGQSRELAGTSHGGEFAPGQGGGGGFACIVRGRKLNL